MAKFGGSKPPASWLDTPATVYQYFKTYDTSQDFLKSLAAAGIMNETIFGPRTVPSPLDSVSTISMSALPVISINGGTAQQISFPPTSKLSKLAHFVQPSMPETDGATPELLTLHQGEAENCANPTSSVTGNEEMNF
ncbi:hypothetical protein QAD02_020575 [Eretmocerus hayati]|uniref:Uncharacterized protein n=1 Tax=Eretmocerus hayati TaxID=131215 RepID=A0ACC2PMZ9_9HYME|nr:hypothetical protein QAD02_020575 [Eretmocerus hayati]